MGGLKNWTNSVVNIRYFELAVKLALLHPELVLVVEEPIQLVLE